MVGILRIFGVRSEEESNGSEVFKFPLLRAIFLGDFGGGCAEGW